MSVRDIVEWLDGPVTMGNMKFAPKDVVFARAIEELSERLNAVENPDNRTFKVDWSGGYQPVATGKPCKPPPKTQLSPEEEHGVTEGVPKSSWSEDDLILELNAKHTSPEMVEVLEELLAYREMFSEGVKEAMSAANFPKVCYENAPPETVDKGAEERRDEVEETEMPKARFKGGPRRPISAVDLPEDFHVDVRKMRGFASARNTMRRHLEEDEGLREVYKANIAMAIDDELDIGHEKRNELAEKLIKLIWGKEE